jgi:hypothetical protein
VESLLTGRKGDYGSRVLLARRKEREKEKWNGAWKRADFMCTEEKQTDNIFL